MKKLITIIITINTYLFASAQVNIISSTINPYSFSPTSPFTLLLNNSNGSTQASVLLKVLNSSNETVVELLTNSITLNSGVNEINQSNLTYAYFNYNYGNNQSRFLKDFSYFLSGKYSYCITIIAQQENLDNYCDNFVSEVTHIFTLVYPNDKDSINTLSPTLTWQHSLLLNNLSPNEYFKMILVEIEKDQTPSRAIIENIPIFTREYLTEFNVNYPTDARSLKYGSHYAWQVQKISNNQLIEKTEPWQFYLIPSPKEVDFKYVTLRNKTESGIYYVSDNKLYFKFEEEYNNSKLVFSVFDEKHNDVTGAIKDDNKKTSQSLGQGTNLYSLDVSKIKDHSQTYILEVINAKSEKFYLKFFINN